MSGLGGSGQSCGCDTSWVGGAKKNPFVGTVGCSTWGLEWGYCEQLPTLQLLPSASAIPRLCTRRSVWHSYNSRP